MTSHPGRSLFNTRMSIMRNVLVRPVLAALAVRLTLHRTCGRTPRAERLELNKGDKIVLIGNTLAERMQYFGHWETLLHSRFPEHELVVRNLGWSADELTLRPRSQDFEDHGHTLEDHKPDVILAFFGFNESFAGAEGTGEVRGRTWTSFITETHDDQVQRRERRRQLVLVSPIAHERPRPTATSSTASANNENIALYTEAMQQVAAKHGVAVRRSVRSDAEADATAREPLTINGIHLTEHGDKLVGTDPGRRPVRRPPPATTRSIWTTLHAEVNEKNLQFFYDYRAVNGYYIYGGRKDPFGVVNFPAEFAKLRKMIANRDQRIWAVAQGKTVPATIDDTDTGEFADDRDELQERRSHITPPEEARQDFKLPEGYEVNLFASEKEFPDLQKPVPVRLRRQGPAVGRRRCPSYPHVPARHAGRTTRC